jgi:hypothetical protein
MSDFSRVRGPLLQLVGLNMLPLTATLGKGEPSAMIAGGALMAYLTRLTITKFEPGETLDADREQRAVESVVITSDTNRRVRVALGSVFIYASGAFALRMVTPELAARVLAMEPAALATLGGTWLGCMADNFWSAVWLSSGALGQ